MTDDSNKQDPRIELNLEIDNLKSRDEILQVMYWMTGEGLGDEFSVNDLRKFLQSEQTVLAHDLELMVSSGLLASREDKFALTEQGKAEGGRRFADEFESMVKPGHFECDEPDCDCHNPEAAGEACKHLSSAYMN
ncbi:MAG: hypothetical protein LC770_12280 [Acidobacteria bacterium]|nr:hypothetical protein [Acidobacteriota bacterium]MCA1603268.1 hypothetical protein [Acidobacteriota bacterium]